jgi:citrate synthase
MNLEGEIKIALKKRISLQMLRELVCQYKQNGGTQQGAYEILEKIRREQMEEPGEDRILELMDFVAGFCAQDQKIWDEILVG